LGQTPDGFAAVSASTGYKFQIFAMPETWPLADDSIRSRP
jgi:hypothetical protein